MTPPSTPILTYQWYYCDTEDGEYEEIEGADEDEYITDQAGFYKLMVTASGSGCGSEMSDAAECVTGD